MAEIPLLMNGFGVRATLVGTKIQTRRPMKVQPVLGKPWHSGAKWWVVDPDKMDLPIAFSPLGVPGDFLYVRETTRKWSAYFAQYQATLTPIIGPPDRWLEYPVGSRRRAMWWYSKDVCPSIHMPKWAARLWLVNTGVKIEQVQDIAPADCEAEGIVGKTLSTPVRGQPYGEYTNGDGIIYTTPRLAFAALWDSIYAKRGLGWDSNCWVWVTSYEEAIRFRKDER